MPAPPQEFKCIVKSMHHMRAAQEICAVLTPKQHAGDRRALQVLPVCASCAVSELLFVIWRPDGPAFSKLSKAVRHTILQVYTQGVVFGVGQRKAGASIMPISCWRWPPSMSWRPNTSNIGSKMRIQRFPI